MKKTKYHVKATSQFKREYKLAMKRGRDIELLNDVIEILAEGESLEEKYRDHALSGRWTGHRECHITPDWLLIYRLNEGILTLTLSRTGSHSDLF
ncbi:MAG: type II toxin-antitoxin system YafQ family toxin [Selenomonas sp.]|nr:type II toxin-antitoxin system YafQ family toxin [Selenomonas sp.]